MTKCFSVTQANLLKGSHLSGRVLSAVADKKVVVFDEQRHLPDSEGPDGLNPDGHVQHLVGDQTSVLRALDPRQLHQHGDVPLEVRHVLEQESAKALA